MYLLAMVYVENVHRNGRQHEASTKMLNRVLVRRIIPWIYRNRVWVLDAEQWPNTMEGFKELDSHLRANLPIIHAGDHWQNIVYYYGGIEREQDQRRRLDEMEKDVMETVRRVLEFWTFFYVSQEPDNICKWSFFLIKQKVYFTINSVSVSISCHVAWALYVHWKKLKKLKKKVIYKLKSKK